MDEILGGERMFHAMNKGAEVLSDFGQAFGERTDCRGEQG